MAIYDAGTASLAANGTVTGVGTTWMAPLTLIRVGATIVFKTEPVKIYTISEIISDTQINVYNPNSEVVPAGTGYAILAHDGITVQGLAQDVAETLRYYQSRETEVADAVDAFNNFDSADFNSKVTQVNSQYVDVVSIGAQVSADSAQVSSDVSSSQINATNASSAADRAEAAANSVSGVLTLNFSDGGTVESERQQVLYINGSEVESYVWTGSLPKTFPVGSTPETSGGVGLGAWIVVGDSSLRGDIAKFDYKDKSFEDSLLKRPYIFESVSEMIAADFTDIKDGAVVKTLKNEFGLICESTWKISSSQLETTYNVNISGGRYAQLVLEPEMSFASFGFGGNHTQNAAAVAEGNRVARANDFIHTLRFPAGTFYIAYFTLDVDRRGFTWDGAGWDATYLVSTSDNISMLHVIIDPRNRAKDMDHFYQTVKGFTIDGDISNKGATAAQRTVCAAHYSRIGYKSVGHRVSNVDICALEVRWFGHTQGRTNGVTTTVNSLRVRYNSVKLDGYIGGASQSTVNTAIHGPSTTLSSAASVGASSITVSSATGLAVHDIIEITGGTMEAKVITAISGSTLTLDSALSYEHTNGGAVRVPVYGTSVTGTLEVGQIHVGNAAATSIHGVYSEGSRIYIYGFANGLEIHGNNIDESAPAITIDSTVDRNSVIRIVCNETAFPINVNIKDRTSGAAGDIIDLYNFPELDIQQNTRAQHSILVNGIYAFKSLKVERFYDTELNDRAFTSFKFTGFSVTQPVASAREVLRFAQDVALRGYDGHSYSISATIRRNTGLSGLIERKGQTSNIGGVISDTTAAASRTLSNYEFFDATNGMDILFGSNTTRMGLVIKGEPSGGQTIKAIISGEIINII